MIKYLIKIVNKKVVFLIVITKYVNNKILMINLPINIEINN